MKNKKILYIILFIIMIIIIGIFISKVKTPPREKINTNTSANTSTKINTNSILNTLNTSNNSNTKTIRREMQKVKADMDNIVDIKEKMFIQQINDVYLNLEKYEGKTIRLQGYMYKFIDTNTNNQEYYYVMRTSPGCCGSDGSVGFEIVWDKAYPEDKEWVEAIGVIKSIYEEEYYGKIPVLYLTSLEVKQERGADFVTQ